MFERQRAFAAHERGRMLDDRGDEKGAELAYRDAIRLDPKLEMAWFNLGLLFKRQRNWAESLRCNERSAELDPRKGQPAWWNLGIAATALRDWESARRAWRGYGIAVPDGEGPIELNFGRTPVRIGPPEAIEVVWCRRIDPARAVIESVPLPESGHRHGDVVLHDGAPNGEREASGKVYSVFDELERWEQSPVPTIVVSLTCPSEEDAMAVCELTDAAKLTYEDWTANINLLCKACSEGRPHASHDHDGDRRWRPEHHFGFAADADAVRDVLDRWRLGGSARKVGDLQTF